MILNFWDSFQLKFKFTNGVALSDPNMKNRLYCSKHTNFVARFGVSAKIGGKIPFQ